MGHELTRKTQKCEREEGNTYNDDRNEVVVLVDFKVVDVYIKSIYNREVTI